MRTKALLVGAAIGAVSLVTSMAQVYSVNIVGYVNVNIPTGWTMIQNPLKASPDNKVINVVPYGSTDKVFTIQKWVSGVFIQNNFDTVWDDETMELNPGEGFFVYNPFPAFTLTFVGEVCTGNSTDAGMQIPLVNGWNMVGSKVPQAGLLQADLGYVPTAPAEMTQQWDNSQANYVIRSWDEAIGWDPDAGGEPSLGIAEATWIYRLAGAGTWARTFNVGP
jgi:hypothetical protein